MASGFGILGNAMGSSSAAGTGTVSLGPDLEVIQTEGLGFLSLAGEAKVRLTSSWSPEPAPSASLLTIASRRGLVAAAGPDSVIIGTTEAVRKAFEAEKDGDSDVRPFQPQLKISLPTRNCQIAFTADENYLIMSAEQGGGLAVYEVQSLLQGSNEPTFQMPTNGEALRSLVPNPKPEKGEFCAVVTEKGNLLMANMKDRHFVTGPAGHILRTQVSCAAWSKQGKQLVAGSGDGTMHQMTPEGVVKAEIPRPPEIDANYFVSFVHWLENDVFLSIHVSTAEQPPKSQYHLITRQEKTTNFAFQKLTDPVDPFGSNKPPHNTAMRLRDYPPSLEDLLVFSSTASPDIGLLSRSKTPLTSDVPADKITNVFTTTELADDSKRATLPMGENMDTPIPIGTALDLSSKEKVFKPIPAMADAIEYSPGPLPGYWVLNAEGILSVWWIIYSDSIKQGTPYPGMVIAEGNTISPAMPAEAPTHSSLTSPFGATTASPFGTAAASSTSAFGAPSFGGASTLGTKSSVWGSKPSNTASGATFGSSAFGSAATANTPKFGQASFGSPAFGQSSGIGAHASPWAAAAASKPAFGQSSFGNSTSTSGNVFGSPSGAGKASMSGGFASFANKGGFAALGSNDTNSGTSIFAATKPDARDSSMESDTPSVFPPPAKTSTSGGFGSTPFKLTSSFQPDPKAQDDSPAEDSGNGNKSMFGSAFAAAVGDTTKSSGSGLFSTLGSAIAEQSTTPTTTPAPSKFMSPISSTPKSSGIFGFPASSSSAIFGVPSESPQNITEAATPKPLKDLPSAPLPPETTSKISYPIWDSSSSSASSAGSPDNKQTSSDAPLPPDFLPSQPKIQEKLPPPRDSPPSRVSDAPLPPDPITSKKMYAIDYNTFPGQKSQAKPKPASETTKPSSATPDQTSEGAKLTPLPGEEATPKARPANSLPTMNDSAATSSIFSTTRQPSTKPQSVFDVAPPKSSVPFVFPTDLPPVSDSSDDEENEEDEEEGTETRAEEEEEGEEEIEDGTEVASEGSGVDVAKDLASQSGDKEPASGFTPQSSFDGLGGSFSTISEKPDQERKSLFGHVSRNVPVFPQPNIVSPRSPSPVRSIPSRLFDAEKGRSFSAPGLGSNLFGKRPQRPSNITTEPPQTEQNRTPRARKEAEHVHVLVDEEDARNQDLLNAEVQPTLTLDEFVAHSGPIPPAGDTIPAQVEAVYRDINAMLDTLGLNARSLTSFITGHAEAFLHESRDKQDLANPDDWVIGELEDLQRVISEDLMHDLDDARIVDVEEKIEICQDLLRGLARDHNKRLDIQKLIDSRLDPDQILASRTSPLSAEQAARQNDLRRDFARFTRLLNEFESSLTMLRAKVVSVSGASGKGRTPTLEAVVRTIGKMTSMAEKRSGDVDVLENQIKRLSINSPATKARSRESSPFVGKSPTPSRFSASLVFSPERTFREGTPTHRASMRKSMSHSMSGSISSIGGGMFAVPRKKISGFGDAEKKAVKERRDKRRAVFNLLRTSLERRGATVWTMENIE